MMVPSSILPNELRHRLRRSSRRALTGVGLAFLVSLSPADRGVAIDAGEIVERVQKQYNSAKDYTLEFTRTFHWKLTNVTDSVQGKIYFKQQNAFRLESPREVYCTDGTLVWTYSSANNQTTIETFDPDDDISTPRRLLVSVPKNSRSELQGEETVDGTDCYRLRLIPKQNDPLMREATIWVDSDRWVMRRLQYVDLNGNVTNYLFRNIRRNTNLAASLFEFDPPAGVEVVDLRGNVP